MFKCSVCREIKSDYDVAWMIVSMRDGTIYDTYRICKPDDECIIKFKLIDAQEDDNYIMTRWGDSGMQSACAELTHSELIKFINSLNIAQTKTNNSE